MSLFILCSSEIEGHCHTIPSLVYGFFGMNHLPEELMGKRHRFCICDYIDESNLHCFPFPSSVPPNSIFKLSLNSFMGAFLRASFIPSAYHPAQCINCKAWWIGNLRMPLNISPGMGRCFFVNNVTYKRNSPQES